MRVYSRVTVVRVVNLVNADSRIMRMHKPYYKIPNKSKNDLIMGGTSFDAQITRGTMKSGVLSIRYFSSAYS